MEATPGNSAATTRTLGSVLLDEQGCKNLQQSLQTLNNETRVPKMRNSMNADIFSCFKISQAPRIEESETLILEETPQDSPQPPTVREQGYPVLSTEAKYRYIVQT